MLISAQSSLPPNAQRSATSHSGSDAAAHQRRGRRERLETDNVTVIPTGPRTLGELPGIGANIEDPSVASCDIPQKALIGVLDEPSCLEREVRALLLRVG